MDPDRLGTELERLPGVLAATVFQDTRSEPRVYLAVQPDADTDAIRATCLALLRDHGLVVHPDHLHIGTAPARPVVASSIPHLALDALEVHSAGSRVECVVRLRTASRTVTGSASEPDTPAGRARAAARATLTATEATDPDLRLGLHGARIYDFFGFDAVAILVEAAVGRSHVQLPGVHVVDRSVEQAAAMATLQALRSWTP